MKKFDNHYAVYEDHAYARTVTKKLDEALADFISKVKDISDTYEKTGIGDTASREAVVEHVSERLWESI